MRRSRNHVLALVFLVSAQNALAAAAKAAPAYAVSDRIKISDGGFDYVSFDPVHRRVYVSRAGGVTAVDVDSKAVTGHLADAQRSHESLPLLHGSKLLITDSGSNSARMVDALTGAPLAEIATHKKPDAALFDPASGLVLVMNGASGDLTLINPTAQKAVGTIAVGGALEFGVADGAGKAFINIEDQGQIAVVNTKTRALVGHYALRGCVGPTGLAFAPDVGVLISACANKVAKVIRASDGEDLATLAIGAGPDAVIYDIRRRLAFIPCGRDGVLEVVTLGAGADAKVIQSVPTQFGARTGALDPRTGTLYLPTARYDAVAGAAKPVPVPGSYELLVVAPAAGAM